MKRLLIAFALVLLPAALFAQVADRDMLLTQEGTLYTIESQANDGSMPADVNQFLRLTIQRGNEMTSTVVPESLTAGFHWRPALAFDSESKTLFVFWLKMPNGMSSELLLTSYANGKWQKAVSIDNQPYHLRYNLRIGITRRVAQLQRDGSLSDIPALLVHAVWWEESGAGETARYALLTIDKGTVTDVELHDLTEFAAVGDSIYNAPANFNPEILKHPAIIEGPTANAVDVIFGDTNTNTVNRVTLRPIADSRIHIPVGRKPGEGGGRIPAPLSFEANWSGRISTIVGRDGKLLFYNTTRETVSYIVYSNGVWSSIRSLPINDRLSPDAAATALGRMINAQ
jgi:hypothetical protein